MRELSEEVEDIDSYSETLKTMKQAVVELKVFPGLEKEISYFAVRDEAEGEDLMNEAEEERHVALVLIAELDKAADGIDRLEAKFKILAESIRRHIRKERRKLLPRIEESGVDLDELLLRMMQNSQEPTEWTTRLPAGWREPTTTRCRKKSQSATKATTKAKR